MGFSQAFVDLSAWLILSLFADDSYYVVAGAFFSNLPTAATDGLLFFDYSGLFLFAFEPKS